MCAVRKYPLNSVSYFFKYAQKRKHFNNTSIKSSTEMAISAIDDRSYNIAI